MEKKYNIIHILTYIYLILKPYYIFPSGNLQISDFFLLIAFFILTFEFAKNSYIRKSINKKAFLYNIFVTCVLFVSICYSVIYFRSDFFTSAIFYIFNLMGIYVLYYCVENKSFLYITRRISFINILVQLALYVLNIGSWYGDVRYMGTFNDPNQFAFYIFANLICVYIINSILAKNSNKSNYLYYIIACFLIIESASTGVLLGLGSFISLTFIYKFIKIDFKRYIPKIIIFLCLFIPILLIILLTNTNVFNNIIAKVQDNVILTRIEDKLNRVDEEEGNLLQERGYDKILKYPYKIILGAGHGYNERFNTYHTGEIHATFPSILFYYGIIPFVILLVWIYENIKNIPVNIKIAYFAVLIESLTLLNERQLLFWFIIILGSTYNSKLIKEEMKYE